MDQLVTSETLQLLEWRAELLAILRGPEPELKVRKWLMVRRTELMQFAMSRPMPTPDDISPPLAPD